jgi:hypothetical protein
MARPSFGGERDRIWSGMWKSGTLRGSADAIEFPQIAQAYLHIPLYTYGIDRFS